MLPTSLDITTYYYLEITTSFHPEGNAQRLSSVILFIMSPNSVVFATILSIVTLRVPVVLLRLLPLFQCVERLYV